MQLLVLTLCNYELHNWPVDTKTPLQIAENRLGIGRIAKICKVSREAARKWVRQGFLPRTEWTGETNYSRLIADEYARDVALDREPGLEPAVDLTRDLLLSVKPTTTRQRIDLAAQAAPAGA